MPLDPMMSDALLGTFRNMIKDCSDKNISGEDFDKMCQTMDRLEELAKTHDDMNAFNGQVMQENLYGKFSDHYGRALAAQSQEKLDSKDGGYEDASLLKMSLDALRDAVKRIRDSKEEAVNMAKNYDPDKAMRQSMDYVDRNKEKLGLTKGVSASGGIENMKEAASQSLKEELKEKPNAYDSSVEVSVLFKEELVIKPIEAMISLGEEEGMTLPKFLRLQIEKGMDKALEGSVMLRDSLEFSFEWTKAFPASPFHIELAEKKIKLFDRLAEASPFKIPNNDELSFGQRRIDYEYEPLIKRWDQITGRWDDLLWDLSFWSLSYCSFAPQIKPWCLAKDPIKAVKKTQDTGPGIFKQRERLLKKYFDIDFNGIFKHDSFEWKVTQNAIGESQEKVEYLISTVYPQCKPFNHLSADAIKIRESLYKEKREINPEILVPIHNFIAFYDSKFGEGRFVSKYGPPEPPDTTAKPWNWVDFKSRY